MANKLAIVTGASTGIGFELATLAAQERYAASGGKGGKPTGKVANQTLKSPGAVALETNQAGASVELWSKTAGP